MGSRLTGGTEWRRPWIWTRAEIALFVLLIVLTVATIGNLVAVLLAGVYCD